jgi:transposase-like protein
VLWGEQGATCPRCQAHGDRVTKLKGESTRPGVYKCKDCRKPFSVTVGTTMERSHIPLTKWLLAAHFMANAKKSMSAKQLQRHIGTNYESAWFLFHRLRENATEMGLLRLAAATKWSKATKPMSAAKPRTKPLARPRRKWPCSR